MSGIPDPEPQEPSATTADRPKSANPVRWVPTLYFAEGLPFSAVNRVAAILYLKRGVSNADITLFTSLASLPWSLKPLLSPFLELFKTKKFFVVLTQLLGGLALLLTALCLPLPGYFGYTLVLFTFVAICSATHDIAADGLYIATLSSKQQATYAGWLGGFWNLADVAAKGGLIALAGYLTARFGLVPAWMSVLIVIGGLLVLLSVYHGRVLPSGGEERKPQGLRDAARTFADVWVAFFRKRDILLSVAFILLFRAGEALIVQVGPLFLQGSRETGGLGLTEQQFGIAYATAGTLAKITGSVLGGYFAARLGLKRALFPLICIMNLPNVAFVYLSLAMPTSLVVITAAMVVEHFGYGFGFVALILFMMQEVAPGRYQMAHYAVATSFMHLSMVIFGAVSGWVQTKVGYTHFFVYALIAPLPALILSRFLPLRGGEPPAQAT